MGVKDSQPGQITVRLDAISEAISKIENLNRPSSVTDEPGLQAAIGLV